MQMKLLWVFLLAFSFVVDAQYRKVTEKGYGLINLERHQLKFNLLSPGIS